MNSIPVIAIFDIGKTNKKLFVFDEQYHILLEETIQFNEISDEDGDACENLAALTNWIKASIHKLMEMKNITVRAINFSAYGASFVHVNKEGQPAAPLYNYLKSFPEELKQRFYTTYGGENDFSLSTASPVLGNLNSGLQLYYLKEKKPVLFNKIHCSLHLPQYLAYLVTGILCSDITSIGCHTALWNFTLNQYHAWVHAEAIDDKLAPVLASDQVTSSNWNGKPIFCGTGLHDSSAALIPYLSAFKEPFVLISTGTWCITLNPFNQSTLTRAELQQDCLCYMEYHGKPVKASRIFAGNEHELQTKKLAAYFNLPEDYYKNVLFDSSIVNRLTEKFFAQCPSKDRALKLSVSLFENRKLSLFTDYKEAYHQLMIDIIQLQVQSANLVLQQGSIKTIFVDGGFGKNPVYMSLLAASFPAMKVYAASLAQASAIGAALAVHACWNKNNLPSGLIELKLYTDIEVIE